MSSESGEIAFSQVAYFRTWQAVKFIAALAFLVVLWQVVVTVFEVNPRIFPDVPTVVRAGWETIVDGSLAAHVGASMLRVTVGTVLPILTAVPLGVAMGVSKGVSDFLSSRPDGIY
ncbi:MAG: hypothetical protein KDK08_12015 [Rhizobiaceae bacterium]|nr:hypothetical protein [Rhizobiaceae bacterium]